jgi:hypothetical protein
VTGTFSSSYHIDPTPLHTAVINGFDEEVKRLLEHDSNDIRARFYGKTPLQYAFDQQSANIADMLFDSGARLALEDLVHYNSNDFDWALEQAWHSDLCDALGSDHHPSLTEADIKKIYYLLARVLSEDDIVCQIMDMAECWLVSNKTRREQVTVNQHTPSQSYVVSLPISGRVSQPVRRIVFKIVSHDQGL